MGLISGLKREAGYLSGMLRMLRMVKDVDASAEYTIADELERRVDQFGTNLAFIEDDKSLTYRQMEDYANRVAHWARDEMGFVPGETVVVFVRNRAEYVPLWFGLAKVGVVPALVNFQLAGDALAHCIRISEARAAVVDADMVEQWNAAAPLVHDLPPAFAAFGDVERLARFESALDAQPTTRPEASVRAGITGGDQAMKMFTSGTTGLPKAAKVTHVRCFNYMRGIGAGARSGPQDRMMMVLPLYHATGGLVGVGCSLTFGGAVIVRPRFSASRFWEDAVKFGATQFTYVGELCRFLLSQPEVPAEHEHKIRTIIGNGLRPEVWTPFVERFEIDTVIEFYGATEGNASLISLNGPPGSVGRVPGYLKGRFNLDIIKYDVERDQHLRGEDGFAIRADVGEAGELIGEIRDDDARFRFDGYENAAATRKKILTNVFKPGDRWFRTGDLLRRDEHDYFYFVDRIGDTFRWKAENVATNEVAGVISKFPGVTQANVYGVEVPGYDGRAGMAAIVAEGQPDLAALKAHLDANLPHYARPVFLRLSEESETTSTFKFKKTNLVKAGFDPAKVSDPLFVLLGQVYQPLDADMHAKIIDGEVRL